MLQRIKDYIDYKGISVSGFEKSIGMSNASFGKSLKNGGTIGADKLVIILNQYPDLDLCWLVTGKGSMIKRIESQTPGILNEPPESYSRVVDAQAETIVTLQKYVKLLESELEKLKEQLQEKEKPAEDDGQKRKAV